MLLSRVDEDRNFVVVEVCDTVGGERIGKDKKNDAGVASRDFVIVVVGGQWKALFVVVGGLCCC